MNDETEREEEEDWAEQMAHALEGTETDEEDAPPFSMLSGALLGVGPDEKIPLEQSPNLIMMREAAAAIRRDEISPEEYLEKVNQMASLADNGIKLFSAEAVRHEVEKLPPEHAALVDELEEQVHTLKKGTDLMARYVESGNIEDLDNGLALVEKCISEADKVQDRALEMAREEAQQEQTED